MKKTREFKWSWFVLCLGLVALVFGGLSCISDDTGELEVFETAYGIEMVAVPGGWFEMGDKKSSEGDAPKHRGITGLAPVEISEDRLGPAAVRVNDVALGGISGENVLGYLAESAGKDALIDF